jgi:trehalose-6-phosphate synthase
LYEAYVQANQKYLEAVALEYQEGDVVLVHDYELMLLPAMIRGRFPDAPVGFFCHCPCDNSVLYTRGRVDGVALSARRCRAKREFMKAPST